MHEAITTLAEALAGKQPAVLATVVEVSGASPAKVGAQMVLRTAGAAAGTVGGGNLEAAILLRQAWAHAKKCWLTPLGNVIYFNRR